MKDAIESKIALLSKMLDTRKTVCLEEAESQKDQMFSLVRDKLLPVLNRSKLSGMGEHLQDVEDCFEDIDIFLSLPELLGNHTIGIANFISDGMKPWMESVLSESIIDIMLKDKEIPMVLAADGNFELQAINQCQHRFWLSPEEYRQVGNLWRDDISIARLLWFYRFALDERWKNRVVSYFPAYTDWQSDPVRRLLSFQDEIFVLMDDSDRAQKYGNRVIKNCQDEAPLYIVTRPEIQLDIQWSYQYEHVTVLTPEQMHSRLLHPYQRHDMRFMQARMEGIFAEIDARYALAIQEQQEVLQRLQIDLSEESGGADVERVLGVQKDEFAQSLKNLQEERKHMNFLRPEILQSAQAVDLAIQPGDAASPMMNMASRRASYRSLWTYLQSKNFSTASAELKKLQYAKDPYAYVFQMLYDHAHGRAIDKKAVQQLGRERENEWMRKAKIVLASEIGLSDLELQMIARDIDSAHYDFSEEYFYRGLWHATRGEETEAVRWWKLAYQHGSERAAVQLLKDALRKKDELLLEWLTRSMDPEANYQAGLQTEASDRYSAEWHFRVAAAQEHLPSVRKVLDIAFWNAYGAYKRAGFPRRNLPSDLATKFDIAQGLCEMLLKREPEHPENPILEEKLGSIYVWRGNYRKALQYFKKSGTAESNYQCGKIYEYEGGDVPQDLDRAVKFFQTAGKMGHGKAKQEAAKVEGWRKKKKEQEQLQAQTRYNRAKSYAPETTYEEDKEEKKSGGCIITTATCRILHKGDDCDELNTLRHFRNDASERHPVIRELVQEYYRVAPLLLEKIDVLPNKEEIYRHLWKDYIRKSYESIRAQNDITAAKVYIQMVLELCRTYHVPLAEGIQEKIAEIEICE